MKITVRSVLLNIAIIVSVLSQIAPDVFMLRASLYVAWFLIIGYMMIERRHSFYISEFTKVFFCCYVMFALFCAFNMIVNSEYTVPNYLRVLLSPLAICIVGDACSDIDEKDLQASIKLYFICAVLYAICVNYKYLPSYSTWLAMRVYAFPSKNSAAQIWGAAILFSVLLIECNNKRQKIIQYIFTFYLFIIVCACQCRTALLGLSMALFVYVLIKSQRKILILLSVAAAIIVGLKIPFIKAFINQALMITKYAGADLNTFSSGRLYFWNNAIQTFNKSPVIGNGKYYVDCSYLMVLAETGVVGFVLIECVWGYRIFTNVVCKNDNAKFLLCITIFYFVESVLEGYPPFGPGVCSFMFWLISQIITNQRRKVDRSQL